MGIAERRKREKEMRKSSIIDAAEKVFFQKGFEAATMDDVAEKAELSKGTLYLYFSSKEDLYMAITHRSFEIMIDLFQKAVNEQDQGIEQVYAIGLAYKEFSQKYPDYFPRILLTI